MKEQAKTTMCTSFYALMRVYYQKINKILLVCVLGHIILILSQLVFFPFLNAVIKNINLIVFGLTRARYLTIKLYM